MAPLVIFACTDIRGEKLNLELSLPSLPASIGALQDLVERVFRGEEEEFKRVRNLRDVRLCEPFRVSRLQRFHDEQQDWADLTDVASLHMYDQLYVYRRDCTRRDISEQRDLPAPQRSILAATLCRDGGLVEARPGTSLPQPERMASAARDTTHTSPGRFREQAGDSEVKGDRTHSVRRRRRRHGSHRGGEGDVSRDETSARSVRESHCRPPPAAPLSGRNSSAIIPSISEGSMMEAEEFMCHWLQAERRGSAIDKDTLRAFFAAAEITFASPVVSVLFDSFVRRPTDDVDQHASRNLRAQEVNADGIRRLARAIPYTVRTAHARLSGRSQLTQLRDTVKSTDKSIADHVAEENELEERLRVVRESRQRLEQQKRSTVERLMEVQDRLDPLSCQKDQQLLDREVNLAQHRVLLAKEEQDFERLALTQRRSSMSV